MQSTAVKESSPVGLHDILHAIVMCISSVKTVLWLAVNLHQLFSNGAVFNAQSRSSLTSYAISRSLLHAIHVHWRDAHNHRMQCIVQPYSPVVHDACSVSVQSPNQLLNLEFLQWDAGLLVWTYIKCQKYHAIWCSALLTLTLCLDSSFPQNSSAVMVKALNRKSGNNVMIKTCKQMKTLLYLSLCFV